MTKLLAGPAIKRKKNPSKKTVIAIRAPDGVTVDLSAVTIESVENASGTIKWTPTILNQDTNYILVEINRIQAVLAPSAPPSYAAAKSKAAKAPAAAAADPPDPGTLTIVLTAATVPPGISGVITDVPVVFVDDTP